MPHAHVSEDKTRKLHAPSIARATACGAVMSGVAIALACGGGSTAWDRVMAAVAAAVCVGLICITIRVQTGSGMKCGTEIGATALPVLALRVEVMATVLALAVYYRVDPAALPLLASCTATLTRQRFVHALGWVIATAGVATCFDLLRDATAHSNSIGYCCVLTAVQLFACYQIEQLERDNLCLNASAEYERIRANKVLLELFPAHVAERLKDIEPSTVRPPIAERFSDVSILFCDIVRFTEISAEASATDVVLMLNAVFSAFDKLASRHGMTKIKTIGDCYMATAGVPIACENHASRAADMALAMQESIEPIRPPVSLSASAESKVCRRRSICRPHSTACEYEPLSCRIGIHSGAVIGGVIGTTKFLYDIWGDSVNLASRMETHGVAGYVQVSEDTFQLLQRSNRGYVFEDRGVLAIKGKGSKRCYILKYRASNPPIQTRSPTDSSLPEAGSCSPTITRLSQLPPFPFTEPARARLVHGTPDAAVPRTLLQRHELLEPHETTNTLPTAPTLETLPTDEKPPASGHIPVLKSEEKCPGTDRTDVRGLRAFSKPQRTGDVTSLLRAVQTKRFLHTQQRKSYPPSTDANHQLVALCNRLAEAVRPNATPPTGQPNSPVSDPVAIAIASATISPGDVPEVPPPQSFAATATVVPLPAAAPLTPTGGVSRPVATTNSSLPPFSPLPPSAHRTLFQTGTLPAAPSPLPCNSLVRQLPCKSIQNDNGLESRSPLRRTSRLTNLCAAAGSPDPIAVTLFRQTTATHSSPQ